MTSLEEHIRYLIRQEGPMRFDRFMELALYAPGQGYYARHPAIGRTGDFYTSVSVGPLFGRLLGRQFRQMWLLLEKPDPFWIVEQGAHDGRLAGDILDWCSSEALDFWPALRYGIIEGPRATDTIALNLQQLATEKPAGVFFSNELVDAFPVRVVTHRGGAWRERCVEVGNQGFFWTDQPIEDAQLRQAITQTRIPEIEGYTTELNLRAREWISEVGSALQRGYVVTLDYGFPAFDYYAPHRTSGTLSAYAQHRRIDDILAHPGTHDITAHVDFTALVKAGRNGGLRLLGHVDQQHFLTGIAQDELGGGAGPPAGVAKNIRAFQTLTHPQHLGAKFFALIQQKNAPGGLDGLRFARPADLL